MGVTVSYTRGVGIPSVNFPSEEKRYNTLSRPSVATKWSESTFATEKAGASTGKQNAMGFPFNISNTSVAQCMRKIMMIVLDFFDKMGYTEKNREEEPICFENFS